VGYRAGEVVSGPFTGHKHGVTSVATSPDGQFIVSGSWDKTIRIWNTDDGEIGIGPIIGHNEKITSISISPDGKHIVSGSDDCTIMVWDVETGEV
jgi:WD40 repeat protein